jgi:hypothetical protein
VGQPKAIQPAGRWVGAGERGGGPRLHRKPEMGQSSERNSFQISIHFLEFSRTLENCTRRFRWNFDMGVLPKIFYASQGFLENEICHAMLCNLRSKFN